MTYVESHPGMTPDLYQKLSFAHLNGKPVKNFEGEEVYIEKIKEDRARIAKRVKGQLYRAWVPLDQLSPD